VYHSIKLPIATSDTRKFNDPVQQMLKKLFRPNIRYHKCGVMLQGITDATRLHSDFFNAPDSDKTIELMKTLDSLNHRFGRDTQAKMKSPSFTTNWNDLLKVKS